MSDKKSVLVIGLEPTLIDFSSPDYAAFPGLDAAKVMAGLKAAEESLTQQGYDVQLCLTDFGESAEATVRAQLEKKRYDCIVIGAGVRTIPANFLLFEKLINVVHSYASQAKICFNTKPTDTVEAVQRWI
jgi:DNA-binding LacI/PurR family transcriptional regulator